MNKRLGLGVVVMITLGTIFGTSPGFQQQSTYAYKVLQPQVEIAASGDNVYVIWDSNKTSTLKEIMFRASSDNAQTFRDKIKISNSSNGVSDLVDVAVSGDNVFVTYSDNQTGSTEKYTRRSIDNGQTFSDPIMLNSTGTTPVELAVRETIPNFDMLWTEIIASGQNTYVTWWDNKTGNWEIKFARSNNAGETYEDTINLSNSSDERSEKSKLAASGDNVYATWWEIAKDGKLEPVLVASNDNGATFGPILRLAANGTIGGE